MKALMRGILEPSVFKPTLSIKPQLRPDATIELRAATVLEPPWLSGWRPSISRRDGALATGRIVHIMAHLAQV
jgi:hypothetical protein